MQVIHSVAEMKSFVREARKAGDSLALIPTMGALHEGHLSLIHRAQHQCGATVVSIFVNPTQFGPSEDFDRYPRHLERDLDALRSAQVGGVFIPTVEEIYPASFTTTVDPGAIACQLEGVSRPGHFRGVATVVLKLFNIVTPDRAYFGQKDFQQFVVIRHLVRDLNLEVSLVVCPTVRDADGVALSSRNAYLRAEERESARLLSRSLKRAQELVRRGELNRERVISEMRRVLESDSRVRLDYVAIVDADLLNSVDRIATGNVALVAAQVGATRLIDNAILSPFDIPEDQLLAMSLSEGNARGQPASHHSTWELEQEAALQV
jgi:pantoate--beta-alanine ligase